MQVPENDNAPSTSLPNLLSQVPQRFLLMSEAHLIDNGTLALDPSGQTRLASNIDTGEWSKNVEDRRWGTPAGGRTVDWAWAQHRFTETPSGRSVLEMAAGADLTPESAGFHDAHKRTVTPQDDSEFEREMQGTATADSRRGTIGRADLP